MRFDLTATVTSSRKLNAWCVHVNAPRLHSFREAGLKVSCALFE